MNRRECYNTLGLPVGASDDDIKKAYRKLVMEWHPDRNKSPEAEEKIKRINEAYDVLTKTSPSPIGDIFSAMHTNFGGFNFRWNVVGKSSLTLELNNPSDAQKIVDLLRMRGFIINSWKIETRG